MTDNQPMQAGPAAGGAAPTGGFARSLFEIFTDPPKVFARIDAGLSWWKPFVAACAVIVVLQLTVAKVFGTKLLELSLRARNIKPEDMERMLADTEKYHAIGIATAPIVPVLAVLLTGLIVALLAHIVINIMTSRASYKKTLSLIFFCGLIPMMEQIIVTAIILARGIEGVESMSDLMMSIGPAALVPSAGTALMAFLQSISIFQIWSYAVFVLGVGAIFKLSAKKAVWSVLPVWLVHFIVVLLSLKLGGGMG